MCVNMFIYIRIVGLIQLIAFKMNIKIPNDIKCQLFVMIYTNM